MTEAWSANALRPLYVLHSLAGARPHLWAAGARLIVSGLAAVEICFFGDAHRFERTDRAVRLDARDITRRVQIAGRLPSNKRSMASLAVGDIASRC